MALLRDGERRGGSGLRRSAARALVIDGLRMTHSAARFWAALVSELAEDFPDCDRILFETLSAVRLDRACLYPESALQREMDRTAESGSLRQALEDTLHELAWGGLPDAVRVQLLAGDRPLRSCALPLDCVDAEIFATLAAWLLEWARIPESQWQAGRLEGGFGFRDPDAGWSGRLGVELIREPVHEGLSRWQTTLRLAWNDPGPRPPAGCP